MKTADTFYLDLAAHAQTSAFRYMDQRVAVRGHKFARYLAGNFADKDMASMSRYLDDHTKTCGGAA